MPNDPDFHDCAAAWLDATGDDGSQRVLREILRDSQDSAGEFAVLARTDAALQLAGLTQSERYQRVRKLIQPSATSRLRWLTRLPAIRVAAVIVVLAGAAWWIMSRGDESGTAPGKSRIAPHVQRFEAPAITRTQTASEQGLPADKDFARRMGRFMVPEFKAVGVPLATALDILRKNIAAIDDTAMPDFSAAPELPDDLNVHLHLRYLPVAVLVDVLAIQTGTKFQPSGKGYRITAHAKAPMPGKMLKNFYEMDRLGLLPFGTGRSLANPVPVTLYAEQGLENCLGEKPGRAVAPDPADEFFLGVYASERLHKMLGRLITFGYWTWIWSVRVLEIADADNQTAFTGVAGEVPGKTFTDPEFQMLIRSVSQMKGVDLMTLPDTVTRPGEPTSSVAGRPSPDQEQPDDWTGVRVTLESQPIGDSEATVECLLEISEAIPNAAPARAVARGTGRLFDGQSMLVFSEKLADGRLRAAFVTGKSLHPGNPTQEPSPDIRDSLSPPAPDSPPAPQEDLPYGIPVVGKSGFVYSPYAQDKGMVDVEGMKRGMRVQCPYTKKHFRVP